MMVLWAIRFFVFQLYESPKYLMGAGRDEEAVEVVHKVAAYNGTTSSLTVEQLRAPEYEEGRKQDTSVQAAVERKLSTFKGNHVKSLFASPKLAYSTSLLIVLWGECFLHLVYFISLSRIIAAFIGLAFPL